MLCSLFRFLISSAADSGKPVGPLTSRHIRSCVSCRRFHQACRTLGEGLRSEAVALSSASRVPMRRILAGLPHARRPHPMKLLWPAVAAACIAVVILHTNRSGESPASPPYSIAAPAIELTATWASVLESPLLAEARNLSSDARSGIRFLVACLVIEPPGAGMTTQIEQPGPPPVQ